MKKTFLLTACVCIIGASLNASSRGGGSVRGGASVRGGSVGRPSQNQGYGHGSGYQKPGAAIRPQKPPKK